MVRSRSPVGGTRRRRMLAGACVTVAALTLTGCSGDAPRPAETPPDGASMTESATPTPTPTPGPTDWPKPERPAAMERDDVVGAKAAAQYFMELIPYATATGDLSEWRTLSHPNCAFCSSVAEGVEELHADGGYGIGPEMDIREVSGADPLEGNPYFSVDLLVHQGEGVEYSRAGEEVRTTPEGVSLALFAMEPSSSGWLVRGVQVEASDEAA